MTEVEHIVKEYEGIERAIERMAQHSRGPFTLKYLVQQMDQYGLLPEGNVIVRAVYGSVFRIPRLKKGAFRAVWDTSAGEGEVYGYKLVRDGHLYRWKAYSRGFGMLDPGVLLAGLYRSRI